MSATFLLGDCLSVMKGLSDKSVGLFICDLPYGQLDTKKRDIIQDYRRQQTGSGGCAWDIKLNLTEFWTQVKRLAKDDHTPVLMFCNTKFGYELIKSNESWFRYDLVWDKGHGVSFLLANKMPMKSHEMVYVFAKKGATYNRIDIKGDFKANCGNKGFITSKQYGISTPQPAIGKDNTGKRCPLSVIPIAGKSAGGHPTEKPKELYRWLIERYSAKDDVVLDPTAGSFNSILVAKELGRKGIGIEKDTNFFWKAVAKIIST